MSEDDQFQGGRSLSGGASEPLPTAWSRPVTTSAPRIGRIGAWSGSAPRSGGIRTLNDVSSSSGPSASRGRTGPSVPADESDDEEGGPGQGGESWFAGGERSGLSIENPDRARPPGGNMVRDFFRRAMAEGARDDSQTPASSTAFSGGGYKLGGDEVVGEYIPDPNAPSPDANPEETPAIRHITFWRDGLSIEDGPLLPYGEPETETVLTEMNEGVAPPQALNVPPGQPVDLRIRKRLTESYTPSKQSAAFSGAGVRLGAPVPTFGAESSAEGATMPGAFPTGRPATTAADVSGALPMRGDGIMFEVDQTLPTTSVQIRLADGTRLVCRMNHTHTVLDLRNFINAANPENLSRPYTIGTTFPNKILDDNSATIESAGLMNSVVVQRWV